MKIKTIQKYMYKGKEYSSLKAVQDAVHNTIGEELLDKIARTCPLEKHRDYEKLLGLLCSPDIRKMLIECFTVTYIETSPDIDSSDRYMGETETELNILDLK